MGRVTIERPDPPRDPFVRYKKKPTKRGTIYFMSDLHSGRKLPGAVRRYLRQLKLEKELDDATREI